MFAFPAGDVAAALALGFVGGAGLAADWLAGGAAAFQAGADPLGAAGGFLLCHPSGEGDQDVLDFGGGVESAELRKLGYAAPETPARGNCPG